jgi:hypothetical protein
MMRVSLKASVVAAVPSRWGRQYSFSPWPEHKATTLQLAALPAGFTAAQVDEIIGNDAWTKHVCDECGKDREVLIRIGEEEDYEARWLLLCVECLQAAIDLAIAAGEPKP